ncbi:hypothetical protein IAT40_005038 [Kwoniella sp. CBS 6097]
MQPDDKSSKSPAARPKLGGGSGRFPKTGILFGGLLLGNVGSKLSDPDRGCIRVNVRIVQDLPESFTPLPPWICPALELHAPPTTASQDARPAIDEDTQNETFDGRQTCVTNQLPSWSVVFSQDSATREALA